MSRKRKKNKQKSTEWEDVNPMVKPGNGAGEDGDDGEADLVDDEGLEVDFFDCLFNQVSKRIRGGWLGGLVILAGKWGGKRVSDQVTALNCGSLLTPLPTPPLPAAPRSIRR